MDERLGFSWCFECDRLVDHATYRGARMWFTLHLRRHSTHEFFTVTDDLAVMRHPDPRFVVDSLLSTDREKEQS